MSLQKGGLILTNRELLKDGILAPVLQMLRSDSARVQLLTARSLKGFIFVLDVDEEHSVYRTFKHLGSKKITSFIIKIVIITRDPNTQLLPFAGHEKKSESKETFLSEARIQQDVWIESIRGGRPELSPSVANLALSDDNIASYTCISQIHHIATGSNTLGCLEYLKYMFSNPGNSLGILLMPNIEDSDTLGNYLDTPAISPSDKNTVLGNTISNIVRLCILNKVIHLDLHADNSLVVPDTKNSFIIDFGTATNLSERGDIYLSDADKAQLLQIVKVFEAKFLDLATHAETTITEKIAFIESVCREISDIGRRVNQPMYNYYRGDSTAYQMDWIEADVYNSVDKDSILLHAFNKLHADYISIESRTTDATIKRYIKENMIFDLTKDVSHYSFNFDVKMDEYDDADADDDDEGKGKTKKQRNKKSKKTKKQRNKKSKKTRKSYKSKY